MNIRPLSRCKAGGAAVGVHNAVACSSRPPGRGPLHHDFAILHPQPKRRCDNQKGLPRKRAEGEQQQVQCSRLHPANGHTHCACCFWDSLNLLRGCMSAPCCSCGIAVLATLRCTTMFYCARERACTCLQLMQPPKPPVTVCCRAVQTSTETFFRTSKFYKAGDEAPPIFLVDGVSYLSVKVIQQQEQQHNSKYGALWRA